MKISLKQVNISILMIFFINSFAHAQSFRLSEKKQALSLRGSEYVSGTDYKTKMIRVKMIGEVNKPGVHLLPKNSDFTTLLSYAGGPTKDADITQITIKRKQNKGYKNIKLDFKDFMVNNSNDLTLKANDLIFIEKETELISTRTLTIIATVLGAVVSGIVINDRL